MTASGNDISISVVIPLYNKEREIAVTLQSALMQTLQPKEIIVVNDGSTDNGEEVVRSLESPLVRIITKKNAGVSAARNTGAAEATSRYIAFLDGDDVWHEGYLEEIARLTSKYPDCGAYSTAFDIISNGNRYPNRSPDREGIVEDYFREAMNSYICQPSATVVEKSVFERVGGFPEGMKLAEDQYFWIKLATVSKVCFSPARMVDYNRTASNRSVSIYRPEQTAFCFEDLYRPDEGNSYRNEYIARCAISKAILLTVKGDTEFGRRTERVFGYTRLYKRGLHKLKILNRLPRPLRPPIHSLYETLAWRVAKKGL